MVLGTLPAPAAVARLTVAGATAWTGQALVVLGGDAHGWGWMDAPVALGPAACALMARRRVRSRQALAADLLAVVAKPAGWPSVAAPPAKGAA